MNIKAISFTSNFRNYERKSLDNKIKSTSCFTTMFRDDIPWKDFAHYLQAHFKNSKNVDVINQACSDGSEPYSFVITLKEELTSPVSRKFLPVYAYDYDGEVLKNAAEGKICFSSVDYPRIGSQGVDEGKYFRYKSYDRNLALHSYEVARSLGDDVIFRQENVLDTLKKLPDYKTDCVFMCRNMYPYLSFFEMDEFRRLLCKKLGIGSVAVFGQYDMQNFGGIISGDLINAGFSYALKTSDCIFVRNLILPEG